LDRASLRVAEVVDRLDGESPVDDVESGRQDVAGDFDPADGREHLGRKRGDRGQHHERGREEPSRPAGVEARERDRPYAFELGEKQARDEEAGDDEEDVHADVAARGDGEPGMVDDDDHHGDGA
jgi:hypothetical protein